MLVKALIVWILIAAGEIINGTIRVRYLQRKYGKFRAKHISLLSGVAIFSTIIWVFLSWVGPTSLNQCFLLGLLWMSLMMIVDIYFGIFVFRYSWQKVADDFNLRKKNLLGVGMTLLFFCPAVVFLLQN